MAAALAGGADALVDIQARSLKAAAALVDRVVQAVDGSVVESSGATTDTRSGPAGGPSRPAPAPRDDAEADAATGDGAYDAVARLAEVWLDLFRRGAQVVMPLSPDGGTAMSPEGVAWKVGHPASVPSARIEVVDGKGSTEVWLHNGSDEPVGPLELGCGPLLSPSGRPLPGDLVIDPDAVAELARRSTRGVRLSVSVDNGTSAGTYRSVVQVSGGPDLWLPLEVHVGGSTR